MTVKNFAFSSSRGAATSARMWFARTDPSA